MVFVPVPPRLNLEDPQGSAQRFVTYLLQGQNDQIRTRQGQLHAKLDGLDSLGKVFQDFQSTLDDVSSGINDAVQNSVTFSDPNAGTGSARGTANPGSWSFHVKQLAQAQQDRYDIPATPLAPRGTLTFSVGGHAIEVDLAKAGKDSHGQLGAHEIAAAINNAAGASGEVQAQVQTINGKQRLTLTAAHTGVREGSITALSIDGAALLGKPVSMAKAKDAEFSIGDSGESIVQSTNAYTGIPGVKLNFTKVTDGSDPLIVTIGTNVDKTIDKLQKMVDGYNKLKGKLSTLTFSGDPNAIKPIPAGPFAGDSAMRSLTDSLNAILQQISHGKSLPAIGITIERDGKLKLDNSRLTAAINDHPADINRLLDKKTGIVGRLGALLTKWTDAGNGELKRMRDSDQHQEKAVDRKLHDLGQKYDSMVDMYKLKYARLGALYARMKELPNEISAMLSEKG